MGYRDQIGGVLPRVEEKLKENQPDSQVEGSHPSEPVKHVVLPGPWPHAWPLA